MNTTNQLLDMMKKRFDFPSDNAINTHMGWPNRVVQYRRRGIQMDDHTVIEVCEELGLDPLRYVAQIHAERSEKSDVVSFWQKIAETASKASAGTAAALVALILLGSHSPAANAAGESVDYASSETIYYVKSGILILFTSLTIAGLFL